MSLHKCHQNDLKWPIKGFKKQAAASCNFTCTCLYVSSSLP